MKFHDAFDQTEDNLNAPFQTEDLSIEEFVPMPDRRIMKKDVDTERQSISEVPQTSTNMKKIKKFNNNPGPEAHRYEYPKPKGNVKMISHQES